jgi:hypothetical protein
VENILPKVENILPKVENILPKVENILPTSQQNKKINDLLCNYCNITFTRKDNLKRHYLKCKNKMLKEQTKLEQENKMLKEQTKLEQENKMLKEQFAHFKKEMVELMNKNCKIHPKTLTKINKQLNTNNINNTYNDNKIINNINLIALGNEDIPNVFTKEEKLKILNTNTMALNNIVKKVHFNKKYPEFNNVLITNTQNSIGYKYDDKEKKFIAVEKSELIHEIINNRMGDIIVFQEELENDGLDKNVNKRILNLIDNMENDSKFIENKHKEIKLIIYNNKEMIEKIRDNLLELDPHSSNIIIV